MMRRNLLAVVCVGAGSMLVVVCTFMVFNFIQLARAQAFVQGFVRQAVDNGAAMVLPVVAPEAATSLSHDRMVDMLNRARQIGPLVGVAQMNCAVQTDVHNLCTGQLMACIVSGMGREGAFEADVAMCRDGDLAAYKLAASDWKLRFTNGDPIEAQDRSPI